MVKKSNTNKLIIGGAVLLGLGAIAYIYKDNIMTLFQPKKLVDQGDGDEDPKKLTGVKTDGTPLVPTKDNKKQDDYNKKVAELDIKLKKGDKGDLVKRMQFIIREILPLNNLKTIAADGDFGQETDQALFNLSTFYEKYNYTTLRKARELWALYSGREKKPFPPQLIGVSNYDDLFKIYEANKVISKK